MRGLLGIVAVAAIVLFIVMSAAGPGSRFANSWQYLATGDTVQTVSGNPQAQASGATDYHAIARQDAIDAGIPVDKFVKQIQVESGFDPDALSPMGAIGIAQIMPSTATGWHVDPHNPVASLSAAAKAMAWYTNHYGGYDKALAAYNAGTDNLNTAISNCGSGWRACVPAETQRYITAVMGY